MSIVNDLIITQTVSMDPKDRVIVRQNSLQTILPYFAGSGKIALGATCIFPGPAK